MFRVLGRACACSGVLGHALECYVLYVWAPAFLVTFEAIFYSNNIWNFLFRACLAGRCLLSVQPKTLKKHYSNKPVKEGYERKNNSRILATLGIFTIYGCSFWFWCCTCTTSPGAPLTSSLPEDQQKAFWNSSSFLVLILCFGINRSWNGVKVRHVCVEVCECVL